MNSKFSSLQIHKKPKTVKDWAIFSLSKKWPLTIKGIYNEVQQNSNSDVTYQAVHKTLLEMEKEGTIERNGKTIQLNKNWIENSKQFFSILSDTYKNSNGKYEIDKNFSETIKMKFDDISTLE